MREQAHGQIGVTRPPEIALAWLLARMLNLMAGYAARKRGKARQIEITQARRSRQKDFPAEIGGMILVFLLPPRPS